MEKDVTRNIEEQLSAFLDGELPDEELALLVRRLERDENFRATLSRYATVGSLLRNEPVELRSAHFRTRVMAAIDTDMEPAMPVRNEPRKPLAAGYLVAATVIAGVTGAYFAGLLDPQLRPESALQQVVSVEPADSQQRSELPFDAGTARPNRVSQSTDFRVPSNRARMMSYLISHGEHASSFPGSFADSRMYVQQANFRDVRAVQDYAE